MLGVLVVEDNEADVELLRLSLSPAVVASMQVKRDVASAWAWLREQWDEHRTFPRLILLDLNLPGRSGHELLDALKADVHLRGVPVVVLSSSANRDHVRQALAEGANSYVCKPVEFDKFRHAIAAIEAFWLGVACIVEAG